MPSALSLLASVLLLSSVVACEGPPPPAPLLKVTSPSRGLVQGKPGKITVTGTALPGPSGDRVARVTVNNVVASLAADGAFSATIDAPQGALLIETTALGEGGGTTVDARAVQSGELRPVGSGIDRAVTAALSAQAFARLSEAAGPVIQSLNLAAMLAPLQPMVTEGDSLANVKVSVTDLKFGGLKLALVPKDGGLAFRAEVSALRVAATAAYGGALIPDGTTAVNVTAQSVAVAGTLVVTPAGTAGFSTRLDAPSVSSVGLRLTADGVTGQVLQLLQGSLTSLVETAMTETAQIALEPIVNAALGALGGPQQIDVLGRKLALEASPSAVTFTSAGALVTMNVKAKLDGSQTSPGYIFTGSGTPAMDARRGFQLALSTDLVNQLLAQTHALGILDLALKQNLGLFDAATFRSTLPPMIAHSNDGAIRLVLGDLIATFSSQGKTLVKAAINAQVDLKIAPSDNAREVALQFGKVRLRINLLDDVDGLTGDDLSAATTAGIGIQLDSLNKLLIKLPVPAIAGLQPENLSISEDHGYVKFAGDVR